MAPPGYPGEERRSYPRTSASARGSIQVLGEAWIKDGRVVNLSRSGVLLKASPRSLGTRVRVKFPGLEASGTVVRAGTLNPSDVAIRFDEVQDSIEEADKRGRALQ